MSNLQATALPHLFILVPQTDPKTGNSAFGSIPYDKKRFGAFKFMNLMRYGVSVLCCAVLCCAVLCCAVLCCAVLC